MSHMSNVCNTMQNLYIKKIKKNKSNQKLEYTNELLANCITDWTFWALSNTEYK